MNTNDDLSRLYRNAVQPEPPQVLDEAILAAARDAAGGRPQSTRKFGGTRRWSVPFALAATVMLTVSLTMMVHDEAQFGDLSLPMPRSESATPAAESAAAPANALAKSRPSSPVAEPLAKPAYAPPPLERENSKAVADSLVASSLHKRERTDNVAQPALEAAPVAQGSLAAGAAAPARSTMEEKVLSAPPVEGDSLRPAEDRIDGDTRTGTGAAMVGAPRAVDKRASSASILDKATTDAMVSDEKSPARWLVEIRQLKHIGRTSAADEMLTEFRKRFPDYKLPDDLK